MLSQDCCGSIDLGFIAALLHLTGKSEHEIEVFRKRLRSHPGETFTVAHLAEIFRSQGKLDEASDVYREAIRFKPDVPKLHGLFSKVLERQGKSDEAKVESDMEVSLYHEVIRRNPGDAEIHQNVAETLFDRGMWSDGLKELHEAFRIAPSSNPFGSIGSGFYSSGNVDRAIALYRETVRVKPADADAHNDLGYYLLDFGEVAY
jgi:tetratricopeptide (TPR) repeat protein